MTVSTLPVPPQRRARLRHHAHCTPTCASRSLSRNPKTPPFRTPSGCLGRPTPSWASPQPVSSSWPRWASTYSTAMPCSTCSRIPYRTSARTSFPSALASHHVRAYVFHGAWEDIGTIRNFFDVQPGPHLPLASLRRLRHDRAALHTSALPALLQDQRRDHRAFTHLRRLPSSNPLSIRQCILGLRSRIGRGSQLHRMIMMGHDYYESKASIAAHRSQRRTAHGSWRKHPHRKRHH